MTKSATTKTAAAKIKTVKKKESTGTATAAAAGTFARGQKWQLPTGHAEIIHVGKTLVQYRFLKTGMVRGALEMKSIPNFAEAMKVNKGRLMT